MTARTRTTESFVVAEALPEPMLLVAPDGVVVEANAAAAELFVRSHAELIGAPLNELVDAEDSASKHVSNALRSSGRTLGSLALCTGDGRSIRVVSTACALRIGSGRCVLLRLRLDGHAHSGFVELNQRVESLRREVSERRRTEVSLRESEARMRAILETAAEGILTFFEDGTVESMNRAAESISGFAARDLVGSHIGPFLSPSFPGGSLVDLIASFEQVSNGEDVPTDGLTMEIRARHRDGTVFPMDFSLASIDFGGRRLFVGVMRDIRERKRLEEKLLHQATHDPLTDIPNRLLLEDRLSQAIEACHRRGERLAVLFIDLDRFKFVNDSLGHEFGDMLLRGFTERLATECRAEDTLARIGGDEFVWLISGIGGEDVARMLASRVLAVTELPFRFGDHEVVVSASVGISLYPRDGRDAQTLLSRADAAMYAAKQGGKNAYRLFASEMGETASKRLEIEARLRKAIEQGQFHLQYQPQISLSTGLFRGVEALVRWNDPTLGMVQPADFIPLAEESGLIVPLGDWVLEESCRQAARWRDAGIGDLRMAVNISPRQFDQPDLVGAVASVLERTGLEPEMLEIELTEGTLMTDVSANIRKLAALKECGVQIAIDDFGTGYSSLAYLQRFAIDCLKIDRSFVRDFDRESADATLVRAIIGLAHNLGLRVVAEGVERESQLALLRREGCDEAQGFLLGRPADADEVEGILLRASRER